MSWIKLNMKFPGTCMVCKEKININEPGLWQKGVGVKHLQCTVAELRCAVCGAPAGCPSCEFSEDCDLETVSQLCICTRCSEGKDVFVSYLNSTVERFSALGAERKEQ